MARPTKQGLDYFPVDVQFDEKVEMFVVEEGADGLGILLTIWQLIYQNEGYFIKNDDDLLVLVRRRSMAEMARIKSIIVSLLRRGVFDPEKNQEFNILTSRAVQRRFFAASSRKKEVNVYKNYIYDGINLPNCVQTVCKNSTKGKGKGKGNNIRSKNDTESSQKQFDIFWERYPRKQSKKKAMEAWKKIKFENGLFEQVLASLDMAKKTTEWTRDNGRFIPYPSTWLNGRRWEDEYGQARKKVGGYEFD